jgi:hypothetical protein
VCGVKDNYLVHCAEMLGALIASATREAAEVLDDKFDADAWACVSTTSRPCG